MLGLLEETVIILRVFGKLGRKGKKVKATFLQKLLLLRF